MISKEDRPKKRKLKKAKSQVSCAKESQVMNAKEKFREIKGIDIPVNTRMIIK